MFFFELSNRESGFEGPQSGLGMTTLSSYLFMMEVHYLYMVVEPPCQFVSRRCFLHVVQYLEFVSNIFLWIS